MHPATAPLCFLSTLVLATAPASAAEQESRPETADRPAAASEKAFDTDAAYARATADLRAGRHEAAAERFAVLLQRDPNNADWLLGRGQSLLALGRPAEAVPVLEKARGFAPAYEDVWRAELNALEASDQSRKAEALLEEAARQFPRSEWPRLRRAELRERELLREAGMVFSGLSPDGRLVEIAELRDHPFMLGSQFHPEFKSRPNRPHPLFNDFMAAAVARQEARQPALNDLLVNGREPAHIV